MGPNGDRMPNMCRTTFGMMAMIMRNTAPKNVSLLLMRERKSLVGLPGRMPGMKPPFCWRFLLISMGLKDIVV